MTHACLKNPFRGIAFLSLVGALAGCGKVGDPLPPIVAIPEPVSDLKVSQAGYDLHFEWTNPQMHVDRTSARELTRALIRADGRVVLDTGVTEPGGVQRAVLRDVRDQVGSAHAYSIEVAGAGGRFSSPSEPITSTVIEVPGPAVGLSALVDQGVIVLNWNPPEQGGELTDGFRVYRSDEILGEVAANATRLVDEGYVRGTLYEYGVVAFRSTPDGVVEGVASPPIEVEAVDRTPPGPPAGLVLRPLGSGSLVTWLPGSEEDLAGYRISRADTPGGTFLPVGEALLPAPQYNDPTYVPGVAYRVSAVDRTGNESAPSEPVF